MTLVPEVLNFIFFFFFFLNYNEIKWDSLQQVLWGVSSHSPLPHLSHWSIKCMSGQFLSCPSKKCAEITKWWHRSGSTFSLQRFCGFYLKAISQLGYHKISNISLTKSQNLDVFRLGCLCAIYWSHVLSGEWRSSWSSADRRCSNYIWVINNLIAY